MSDGCELAINIATLRKFVPPEILNLLEERCRTEMMQKFASFEECKTEFCVAVVEFSQSPQQTQYFHCPACTAAFCRICKRDKVDHLESTCEEMADRERAESERKRQAEVADVKRTDINRLTKEIDEAKIRKCPTCGKSALKNLGDGSCNKMTCACGAKYCYLCLASGIDYNHFVE
ncbi:hypothetical protein AAVH_10806 [Aphelenchoides avenae]|nr:hypothetical protein AAVH_10806 [Aphelenchus avenae]